MQPYFVYIYIGFRFHLVNNDGRYDGGLVSMQEMCCRTGSEKKHP